ncbi:hypothetical protein BDW42DRAFT_180089 [Aspergillus taichungensis]|uniref:Uncharacterized protein n=1 Tax=Aspergillus taichungensis TaxID=482145 RepID=A0A2J5HFV1_9EURO|nr:hypothetical protein BDW42DRAFT_180089 [Aspergillus taichungensis]
MVAVFSSPDIRGLRSSFLQSRSNQDHPDRLISNIQYRNVVPSVDKEVVKSEMFIRRSHPKGEETGKKNPAVPHDQFRQSFDRDRLHHPYP